MVTVVAKPIVCPVLIGRAAYVQALSRCIAEARGGHGQAMLVAGDAGIGKSRLVAEATARAADEGLLVLQGNCFEPDRLLPYAPLLDLLRGVLAAQSPRAMLDHAGPAGPALARLLPELAALLPDSAPPAVDPVQEKHRLFEALTQVFVSLASHAALVVVMEDLHWGDDGSLDFLLHLARRTPTLPLLLIGTYRSDEVHPGLQHVLAGLDRERLATEMALPHLDPSEVDAMLRAIFDLARPASADFLHALCALTEGNPFFIEEILKALSAAGDITYAAGGWERKPLDELRIPRTVQDAVGRRTALLTPGARQVLALAAVAGRHFPFDLLQQVARLEEGDLLERIKELVAAQLVVETPDDRFAFRHALTRQAVYSALLARERRALHQEIAETIERLYSSALDAHLADLAEHFSAAGAWAKATEYACRAGALAQSLYAPRAAVEQFGRAIAAARQLALAPSPQVYRARGLAYETLGDFERAQADHEAALYAAREVGDSREEWHALMALGTLWAGRDYTQTGQSYRQATDLAQALGATDLHAHSLNRLGNWLINAGQVEEGLSAHHAALDLWRGLDSREGTAETLDLLGMAYGQCGDVRTSVARLTEAIDLFRMLHDQRSLSSSLAVRAVFSSAAEDGVLASALRPPHDCQRDSAEALHLARQIDWPAGQAFAHIAAGMSLGGFGQLGAALAHAREALRIATDIDHQQWMAGAYCSLGTTYHAMLAPDPAVEVLETALPLAQALGSAIWVSLISAELAQTHLLRGDLPRAEAVLATAVTRAASPPTSKARWVALARADLALAQGRHEAALRQAQDLIDSTPGQETSTSPHSAQPIPTLLKLKGEALMRLGRLDEAAEALKEAERGALQRTALPLAWQIYRLQGRLHRARRREDEAARADAAAREVIAQVAATIDDERLRAGFLHAALGSLPRERPVTPLRAAKQSFGGLTERERDVAALVAEGKANREIAELLVVNHRTVEKHIENILSKLGFASRAQIAVWAAERGLRKSERSSP